MTPDSSTDAPAQPSAPAAAQPVAQAVESVGAVESVDASLTSAAQPREFGGRKDGTEPTRFGDWEKNGRCIDF